MKHRIKKAYDCIHLSEASKERILEVIMDSQKPGYRTVQKRVRMTKWRAIPVALMLVVVIAVGAFVGWKALGGKDTPSVATQPPGSISTDPIDLSDPIYLIGTKDAIDYNKEYADVPVYIRDHVILYAEAIYEDWPLEDWERIGLSSKLYQVKDRVTPGFVLKDLDNDGFMDLLIYGGSQLYQILIIEHWSEDPDLESPEHTILHIACEYEQAEITLCEDNVIMIASFTNDRDYHVSYNRIGKSEYGRAALEMIETVFAIDGTEWFAGPNDEEALPITGDEAEKIMAGYDREAIEPRVFLRKKGYLMNYQHQFDGVDDRYLPLLMNYGKAMCEGWSQSRWIEAGLSPEVFHAQDEYWSLEYALVDMDGNGTEELLIFGDDQLYALYVLRDDVPDERLQWKIQHDAERVSVELCENYVVKVCQNDPMGGADTSFYRVGKDGAGDLSLVMVNNVLQTQDGQWYAGPNAKDAVSVTQQEAQEIIASYDILDIETKPMLNKIRID